MVQTKFRELPRFTQRFPTVPGCLLQTANHVLPLFQVNKTIIVFSSRFTLRIVKDNRLGCSHIWQDIEWKLTFAGVIWKHRIMLDSGHVPVLRKLNTSTSKNIIHLRTSKRNHFLGLQHAPTIIQLSFAAPCHCWRFCSHCALRHLKTLKATVTWSQTHGLSKTPRLTADCWKLNFRKLSPMLVSPSILSTGRGGRSLRTVPHHWCSGRNWKGQSPWPTEAKIELRWRFWGIHQWYTMKCSKYPFWPIPHLSIKKSIKSSIQGLHGPGLRP